MTTPSPKKPVFLGMDGFDLALAVIFIGVLAGIGAMLLPNYVWLPGIVVGVLLIYLAWRRRFKPAPPKTPPPDDFPPEI